MNEIRMLKLSNKWDIIYFQETQHLSKLTWYKTTYLSLHMGRIQNCRKKWKKIREFYSIAICQAWSKHYNISYLSHNKKTQFNKKLTWGSYRVLTPPSPTLKWVPWLGNGNLLKGGKVPQGKKNFEIISLTWVTTLRVKLI